jgi:uncharacterized membrane protein YeaQ/YmgE (transglycosylase-associated protein family)
MLWTILVWIIFGLVVGAVARFLVPGRQPMGLVGTIALGVAGSVLGGLLSNLIFGGAIFALHAAGFVGSLIGAIVLLLLARAFRR